GFRPGPGTGWNDAFPGENSSRTLRVLSCRTTRRAVDWSRRPWHLKHTSYSNDDSTMTCPPRFTPDTPLSRPVTDGALAWEPSSWWGLWQSTHVTCRAIVRGSSRGSWIPSEATIGWTLGLLNSASMFVRATFALWQTRQTFRSSRWARRRTGCGAVWGR